jgi:two-component system phosphate regulon sensor histidine kinase PhoR
LAQLWSIVAIPANTTYNHGMWRSRMFWRLFGAYGLLLLSSIGLLGVVLNTRMQRQYRAQVTERLRAKAVLVRELVREWPADRLPVLEKRLAALGSEIGTRITLIDGQGKILGDSDESPEIMENHADRPEFQEAASRGWGAATRFSHTLGKTMMYLALRVENPNQPVQYVRTALPSDEIDRELAALRGIIWTAAAVTGGAAMLLALWLARRITQPIEELTRGAERIAAAEYAQKVYLDSHDEVGRLAQTFNRMSEQLSSQFAQLEADRYQLRAILSGMVEGVVALDSEERILFANDRAAQLLGFQTQAAVGKRVWEVVRQRALQDVVRKALLGSEPCQGELNGEGTTGRSLAMHAARLPGSPTRGAVLVLHDITELRRLERVRQEFVANVSHELKTPLSVIKACTETLLDGAADDPTHRGSFLEQIGEQAERLHALILDLISLARIESGVEAFEFDEVPLEPIINSCLERNQTRAETKKQLLQVVAPEREPRAQPNPANAERFPLAPPGAAAGAPSQDGTDVTAWADEEAVSQILDNLVDNALKYTPEGGRIWVRWWGDEEYAYLEIEDTGIGIPDSDLPRIFERFYRADKARSRQMGGTGLGLSIVKHLVQAMYGTVQASSRLGQGTRFRVRLPRAPGG